MEITEGNISKFLKSVQTKIDKGLIVPSVFSDASEDKSVEEIDDEEEDDWYMPIIVDEVEVTEEWWESDDDKW